MTQINLIRDVPPPEPPPPLTEVQLTSQQHERTLRFMTTGRVNVNSEATGWWLAPAQRERFLRDLAELWEVKL